MEDGRSSAPVPCAAGPTGTAYILQFEDNDNAIVLVGGANQDWPGLASLLGGNEGSGLRAAIGRSSAAAHRQQRLGRKGLVLHPALAQARRLRADRGGRLDPEQLDAFGAVAAPQRRGDRGAGQPDL